MPGISVIICCFNSASVIENTLGYLKKQVFTNEVWEVILVDNNSTDQTATIAQSTWDNHPPLNVNFKIVPESKAGLSFARQTGIEEASYPIISFVDDDNHVPENWISYLSKTFQNMEIGILGCTAIGKFDSTPPDWYENFQHSFATGRLYEGKLIDITDSGVVYGAGMSFRKQLHQDLYERGWKPYLSGRTGNVQSGGEDSELCLAARLLGYKIFYSNEIEINHYIMNNRITWDRLKKMTYGFGAADVYLLIYQILYKEKMGAGNLITHLRKKWWFNYIGKKTTLTLKKEFIKDNRKREIYTIRINSFCEIILLEKEKFEEGFADLKKVFN